MLHGIVIQYYGMTQVLRPPPPPCRWVWVSVGFLIGAIILFHVIIILAQKVLGPLGKNAAVLSEEALRARDIALYGQSGKGDLDDTIVDVNEQVWVCCCH